jgi:hypothetical protein
VVKQELIVLAAILASTAALAQALPNRSVELFCAKRAKSSGMAMNDLFGACVEAERASLAELQDNWTSYSVASRSQCIKIALTEGLYSDLEACIEGAEALRKPEGR